MFFTDCWLKGTRLKLLSSIIAQAIKSKKLASQDPDTTFSIISYFAENLVLAAYKLIKALNRSDII